MSRIIPTVIVKDSKGRERSYDIYSMLLKDRIIFLNGEIDSDMADNVIAQLFYLEKDNNKEDIFIYIDSPGGCVMSGLKIYDTMKMLSCKVGTLVTGLAASMGFFLLSGGERGMRQALPNAQIMAHQVSSGTRGHVEDMRISFEHTLKLNNKLADIICQNIGMKRADYDKHVVRDKWMDTEEAIKFGKLGVIDSIVSKG